MAAAQQPQQPCNDSPARVGARVGAATARHASVNVTGLTELKQLLALDSNTWFFEEHILSKHKTPHKLTGWTSQSKMIVEAWNSALKQRYCKNMTKTLRDLKAALNKFKVAIERIKAARKALQDAKTEAAKHEARKVLASAQKAYALLQ